MQALIKSMLASAGRRTPRRFIHYLNASLNYLETGRWLAANGFQPAVRVAKRFELFDLIIRRLGDRALLYLEFGVFRGESIRYWSSHLANPDAMLHGFDSFEGLPDDWNIDSPKGWFTTNGKVPEIADPRVQFHKGWFEETLPAFIFPKHDVLVANMDADLYSSTSYVLKVLLPRLSVGSYLYFDEFTDRLNELKAFSEFLAASKYRFELIGATKTMAQVVFARVG